MLYLFFFFERWSLSSNITCGIFSSSIRARWIWIASLSCTFTIYYPLLYYLVQKDADLFYFLITNLCYFDDNLFLNTNHFHYFPQYFLYVDSNWNIFLNHHIVLIQPHCDRYLILHENCHVLILYHFLFVWELFFVTKKLIRINLHIFYGLDLYQFRHFLNLQLKFWHDPILLFLCCPYDVGWYLYIYICFAIVVLFFLQWLDVPDYCDQLLFFFIYSTIMKKYYLTKEYAFSILSFLFLKYIQDMEKLYWY